MQECLMSVDMFRAKHAAALAWVHPIVNLRDWNSIHGETEILNSDTAIGYLLDSRPITERFAGYLKKSTICSTIFKWRTIQMHERIVEWPGCVWFVVFESERFHSGCCKHDSNQ